MKKSRFTIWNILIVISAVAILCMLSSCSTSHGTTSHGWGMESKCGKKKPGKWQRYKVDRNNNSYEIDRNGNVQCHTWW